MSMELPYKLGGKLDRLDPRDKRFRDRVTPARVAASKATDRKVWPMVGPAMRIDQGAEGTCVTHAATNVLMAGPSEHPLYPNFQSEDLAHQFARTLYAETSGDPTFQKGMFPRDAAAGLLARGLIGSYWRITSTEELITALLTHGPVSITLPWYVSMYYRNNALSSAYGKWWVRVNTGSAQVGYHEVAATGIDLAPDNGAPPWLRIENSWGHGWAENGIALIALTDFERIQTYDHWTYDEVAF